MTEQVIKKLRPALIWVYSFRRRFATVTVALLAGWLLVHVMFGANGMMVYRAKRAEVQRLQREIDSLKIENDRYDKQINDLRTDPKTIEKEAREQLHYARPGEVVYVAPAPISPEPAATNAAQK
jgi:cell division protein FtsB